jgi:hypothetical protein
MWVPLRKRNPHPHLATGTDRRLAQVQPAHMPDLEADTAAGPAAEQARRERPSPNEGRPYGRSPESN